MAGHQPPALLPLTAPQASATGYMRSQHECAYLLAKGRPQKPEAPICDVMPWAYSGNHHHPSKKAVKTLLPLVEAFSPPDCL